MDLRMRIDVGVSTGDFEIVSDTARCVLGCNPKQAAEKSSSAMDRWDESQNESCWCCPTQPAALLAPHPGAASAERRGGVDGHIVAGRSPCIAARAILVGTAVSSGSFPDHPWTANERGRHNTMAYDGKDRRARKQAF